MVWGKFQNFLEFWSCGNLWHLSYLTIGWPWPWKVLLSLQPCFLKLTIFEILQSKSNFLPCLAMAMNSGLLCPRWLYLHSQCALSRCEPRAAAYAVAAFHASSRELACEPHWCHTSRRRCKLSAARRLARTARRTPCTALSSLCWKQQSAKFNIQTSRSLQPFCFPVSFPFYSCFFSSDFRKKGLHYVNFIGFWKTTLGIWT